MSKVGESEGWVCHVERQKDPQGPGERRGRRRKDKSSVLGLIWGPEVVGRDGEGRNLSPKDSFVPSQDCPVSNWDKHS